MAFGASFGGRFYPEAPASPRLNDIFSRYGVSEEKLRNECREEVLLKIACELREWDMVGRRLNVPRHKLTEIDRDNRSEGQRKLAMLDTWHEREGGEATYLKLAHALYDQERRDLVELLCQILATSVTARKDPKPENCGVARRMETLEQTFAGLHRRLQSELTEGEGVSAVDFLHSLSMLPVAFRNEYENTIHEMLPVVNECNEKVTVRLFLHFSPLFVFLDFSLLRHLITRFGSSTLKEDMKAYVAEVTVFMRETTVADVIDLLPGQQILHLNYSKVKAKFAGDPKDYTLERLNKIRKSIFSRVRLSEFIFWVISMETAGSFIVYWLIPTSVVPDLIKAAKHFDKIFCMEQDLLSLSLIESIDMCISLESDVSKYMFYTTCIDLEDFKERIKRGIHNKTRQVTDQVAKEFIEENITLEYTERDLLTNQRSYAVSVKEGIGKSVIAAHHLAPISLEYIINVLLVIIIATALVLGVIGYITGGAGYAATVTLIGVVLGFFYCSSLVLICNGERAFALIKEYLKVEHNSFIGILMQLGEVTNTGTDRTRITIKRH